MTILLECAAYPPINNARSSGDAQDDVHYNARDGAHLLVTVLIVMFVAILDPIFVVMLKVMFGDRIPQSVN